MTLSALAQGQPSWKVGDKVDAWNLGWYPGTIKESGSGKHQGYYLVKWDKFASEQWVEAKNLRAPVDAQAQARKNAELKLAMGKYQCAVFLGGTYTRTGTFTLHANGAYDSSSGAGGKYTHDVSAGTVTFLSGVLEDSVGRVEAEPAQNRMIIRLNKKKDMGESKSTQNLRAQYCSPVK